MGRTGATPILCVNVNITTDTMPKFDSKIDFDAKCELTFKHHAAILSIWESVLGSKTLRIRPLVQ